MIFGNAKIAATTTNDRQVVVFPDPAELVSDEDSEEEEDTAGVGMDVNHLGKGILRQNAELEYNDVNDDDPDVEELNDAGEVVRTIWDETALQELQDEVDEGAPGPSKRRRGGLPAADAAAPPPLSRKKNKERLWSRTIGADFGKKIPPFQPSPPSSTVPDDAKLPYDFLRLFLDDSFINKLVIKSRLYCTRRGAMEKLSCISKDTMLTSMGIMYMSGYIPIAQKEMWWQNRVDSQHTYIKKAMTRDEFRAVTSFTYFSAPEDQDLADPFWKVRLLFDQINDTAKNLIQQTEYVSVDETIVRYFGPHPLKQAIREKPER